MGLWGKGVEERFRDGCLSVGARWGTWRVRWHGIFRDSWRAPERDHVFAGALLGNLLSGNPEGQGEGSGDGHYSPVSWGVRSPGTLRVSWKGFWKRGILYGVSVRGTWGAPFPGTQKVMKGRLWGWVSLLIGAQLGNLEWAPLLGALRYGWKGH
jgi:hypothetical protein